MAVIAAFKLHNLVASGCTTRQTNADSVASVPELTMRTISQLGISRVSVSAIVTSSAFGTPNDTPFFITSETACNTWGVHARQSSDPNADVVDIRLPSTS